MSAYSVNKKSLRILFGLFFITLFLYLFKSSYSAPIQHEILKELPIQEQKKMAFVTFLCDDVMVKKKKGHDYALREKFSYDVLG